MMVMDKTLIAELREDMKEALKKVEEKHGVDIALGNGSYTATSLSLKLDINILNEGESLEETQFKNVIKMYGGYHGITEEDFLKEFEVNGETYELIEINTRAPKYPIIGRGVKTQNKYKFPLNAIK